MKKLIVLQCDASTQGLGASLMQDGKPVAYFSRSLTKCEQKYAPIELECLAIVFACRKFDQYIYGHAEVTIHSDHKPLEAIFRKSLLEAPKRLQRMMLAVQRYNVKVEYKPGKEQLVADMLSRAPSSRQPVNEMSTEQIFQCAIQDELAEEIDSVDPQMYVNISEVRIAKIRQATAAEDTLQKVMTTVRSGWPENKRMLLPELKPYWTLREEIAANDGILYKGQKETLRSRDLLSKPWAKVGIDLFTYANATYLIMVDYYSDFFEFTKCVDQRAETTIQACKEQFARYGVPQIVQSDGGPQFISAEFQAFANNWEFKHSMSSPYHSQSNGKAESAVKIVKNFLKKSDDPLRAVLEWRNTPTSQINCSPVQRLMQRRTRASVPQAEQLMKPMVLTARKILRRKVKKQKMSQQYYDRNAHDLSPLRRGTPVFMQSLKKYDASKWAQGMVTDQCSNRSYIVEIKGRLLRCNRRYLRIDHTIRPTPSTSTEQVGHRDGTHSRETHVIPTDENTDSRELESCEMPAVISMPRPEPVPTSPVKTNSPLKTRSGRLIIASYCVN